MKRLRWTKLAISLWLIVGLWTLSACRNHADIQRLSPLPPDPFIEVYFNHNQAQGSDYSDPYRDINRPGDNLEKILIDNINSARSTLDIAVQEFRIPDIAKALAKQSQKGIKIRVIIENNYNKSLEKLTRQSLNQLDSRERDRYETYFLFIDSNNNGVLSSKELRDRDALFILNKAKIPIIDDTEDGSKGTGLMHHKFMVVDQEKVIVTSANFTLSDIHGDFNRSQTRGNANNLLKIKSQPIAQLFTEEFNIMWGDGVGGKKDSKFGVNKPQRSPKTIQVGNSQVTVKFSPNSSGDNWEMTSNGLIGNTLNQASNSVELALFVFSDQKLANLLEHKNNQGVQIKALIDPGFAFLNYSEGLDMLGVALSNNCQYELDNNPWVRKINTVGIPQIPEGDKLHHKFGIVDDDTIITGSHNWSASANFQNDETLLVIKNPIVTAHYLREFELLYSNARLGIPDFLEKKLKEDSQRCPDLSTSTLKQSKIVNLNTASSEELESLPGIGEKLAQRIIKARQEKNFTSLEDLKRVSGISQGKLKKLEGKVTY